MNDVALINEVGEMVSYAERVIERFTPINGDRINHQATISDPLVYTRPWTIAFALNRQNEELLEVVSRGQPGSPALEGHSRRRAADVRLRPRDDRLQPGFQHQVAAREHGASVEYVLGSTLFVVWDLSQADSSRPGEFRPLRDIGSAFGAEATNVLMVKVTYWMNR